LIVFGDHIYSTVLGAEWLRAGIFSSMLGTYFFFRLLAEPMISLYSILGRERRLFGFQLAIVLLGSIGLYVGIYVLHDVNTAILLFGISGSAMFAYLGARILHASGVSWFPRTTRAIVLLALVCGLSVLLRSVLFGNYFMDYS